MLNERKLTERELESREVVLQGLLQNKQNLVKKYGKDAEKVMYGIATKKAKTKVEGMNKDKIKELIQKSLTKEDATPKNKDFWADYQDISQFYLEGFGKEHTLTNDQLENLGKKIVKQLYKGDVGKAYDDIVGRVRNKSNDPKSAVVDRAGNTDSLAPGEISEADAIPTSPGKMEKGDDGKMYNVIMSNAKRKMALRSVIDILKAELEVSNDDAFDYIRTHRDDLFDGTVDAFDKDEVVNDYKEYLSVNEDNDPSGADLEGDPDEKVMGEEYKKKSTTIDEKIDYDEALNLRAIKAELEGEIQGVRMEMEDEGDESKADYYGDILNRFESRLAKVQRQLDDYDMNEGVVYDNESSSLKAKIYAEDFMRSYRKMLRIVDGNFGEEAGAEFQNLVKSKMAQLQEDDMNEEVTEPEEKKLKKISKELKGASKMHAGQAKKIAKILKEKALPIVRKKLAKPPKASKVASKRKMKLPSGLVNYMDFTKSVSEKLTKKNDAGDFVDDFKKSDAKQFKGKSDKKKKEIAVAAYLSKQND